MLAIVLIYVGGCAGLAFYIGMTYGRLVTSEAAILPVLVCLAWPVCVLAAVIYFLPLEIGFLFYRDGWRTSSGKR